MAIGALAALALLFGMHVSRWHVPYRLEGIAGELPLLACAVIVGGIVGVALPRIWRRLSHAGLATAAVAALVAFAMLQALDPLVVQRDWRYAPEGCDYAVRFPRPPEIVAGEARVDERQRKTVTRALLTNVGAASSLSAECLVFERPIAASDRATVLAAAEAQLKASAARLRLKIEHIAREGRDVIMLSGMSDEGRTATNETLLRRAKAEVRLGRASLLIVWGWRMEREGETPRPSPLAGLGIEAASSPPR